MGAMRSGFRGAMLGLAVGDALGFPAEFIGRDEILRLYGPDGLTDFVASRWHPAGTFTDDTQMSLAVAYGLLAAGRDASLDAQMDAVAAEFVRWSKSPDNNRAPGGTCMTGCERLAAGAPWRAAGVPNSKGCGSAMRVTAIGLLYAHDVSRLLEVARASSLPTHGHDAAIEGAAACALCVGLALAGATPSEMLAEVVRACAGRSADFDAAVDRFYTFVDAPPQVALSTAGLGEAWVAEEAFVSALYCVWHAPSDFSRAVLCGANTDGDSDSIAAIAGSISGARNGELAIPERWRYNVEGAARLVELADELYDAAVA